MDEGKNMKVAYSFCESIFYVSDFNNRNKCLTAKLLKQGYRYHKSLPKS